MKLLGKTRDGAPEGAPKGAIDSLLRGYISRPTNRVCSEFDPDLANAYVERCLPDAARSSYEQHLSECGPCRKNVIALSRLAEPELRPSISARAAAGPARRQIFGMTSWPRWGMAAAAVIVIAVSLPLLLTHKVDRSVENTLASSQSPAPDNSRPEGQTKETSSTAAAKVPAEVSTTNSDSKSGESKRVDAVSSNGPAPTQQPAVVGGDKESLSKVEPKPAPVAAADQVTSDAPSSPEAVAGRTKQADRQGSVSARQQQPSKDAAADTKASGNEQEGAKKEQVAERAATIPPPAAPPVKTDAKTDSAKSEKLKHSAGTFGLRESSSAEAVRAEKKVANKKFSLRNDTWTDNEFNAAKDLPSVTVIRDSNVYNELLSKRAGLKTYFNGFPPTDRAIIVYKGTVYKLIPQQSDK